ncbi:MAG: alpha-glucosidase [Pedosphaera sp.]|nr:alpha-glucosidase [Pedosphaera sp.]
MRKPVQPAFSPVGKLAVSRVAAQSVLLHSANETVELSVLADNLFRLRIASGKQLSRQPSWAVSQTDWSAVSAAINHSTRQVVLQTSRGRLVLRLEGGAWELTDAEGRPVFSAKPGATGFAGEEARLSVSLMEGESLFGLGETTGTYNKRGLIREFWNLDVLGHSPAIHPSLRSLYVSIPFAISLRAGRAAGLFWDNPARQTWDLGQTVLDQWQMKAASGEIDLFLFLGPSVKTVVSRYTDLTGRMPLPPRWALGYQQCRYSYETRARFETIARNFRRRKIPCDVLYLDIHHMDDYRVFTFGKTFSKPAQLMAKLARQGFKVVTIVDPGVKDDPKFAVLKRGRAVNAFVKEPNGKKDYIGKVWPGEARFPDFLRAEVRQWWGREQAGLLKLGVVGFWNDMNEPANFALPTKTLPEESRHAADTGPMRHRSAHNLYGMQMARASRNGALAEQPNARPFVITRAGYAGVQRYAMVWTGDNSSIWEHLSDAIQMFLNLSVSGLPFCGGDIGGFMDNTTPELLVRWLQMATFTPFYRNHSNLGTIDQEPWAFGPKVESICRRYIELRYQLLPYLYGLFVEAHHHGTPIMRPLFWHYQDDAAAVAAGDQFMLGPDLLVAPILRQGATARSVYLPHGNWFNFWTGESHAGGRNILAPAPVDVIPLFVRAGAMLPMSAVQQFVGEKPVETVNLHLWPGAESVLNWHEDDGISMGYAAGELSERQIKAAIGQRGGTLQFSPTKGSRAGDIKTWRVILRGVTRQFRIKLNGRPVASHFDPTTGICAFEFRNSSSAMEIRLR